MLYLFKCIYYTGATVFRGRKKRLRALTNKVALKNNGNPRKMSVLRHQFSQQKTEIETRN